MCIRLANRTNESDGLMARQSFLNLSWVNVVTTANNEIFGAACDPQVAIRVHPPQIPRTQVTVVMI